MAEHTWRMALMAIALHKEVDKNIDLSHVLKMIIVHDLGEVYAGDYQVYGKEVPENKHELEEQALKKLLATLPNYTQQEIMDLWNEFENRETIEAKFAVALDKLEVIIQHNEADLSTYLEGEGEYNLTYAEDKVIYNDALKEFRELIKEETKIKIGNKHTATHSNSMLLV